MQPVDYNEISKIYDDVREAEVTLINHFLQELPSQGGLAALDIGCGTGNYTDLFQKVTRAQGWRVYGIDPSEGMLAKARQKNALVVFQQGSAAHIPTLDGFFDFAYLTDVIHHVPNILEMIQEIRRVLKPQGKLCIVTQSHRQIALRPTAQFFPGTVAIDQARYPDIPAIVAVGQLGGLSFLKQETLFEGENLELGAGYLELVTKKGYSMLRLLSEAEYQVGLGRLEATLREGPVKTRSAGDTLVWFVKG
jgi:SAM-dependent methyltransferase